MLIDELVETLRPNESLLFEQVLEDRVADIPNNYYDVDYTIPLNSEESKRDPGGIKKETDYVYDFGGGQFYTVVKKTFSYVYDDPDPNKIGVHLEHCFLYQDGGVGLKKKMFKRKTVGDIAEIRQGQRKYAIGRLDKIGRDLPAIQPSLQFLREFFKEQIDFFIDFGTNNFQDEVLRIKDLPSSADPQEAQMIVILNSQFPFEGKVYFTWEAIVEQTNPHYIV